MFLVYKDFNFLVLDRTTRIEPISGIKRWFRNLFSSSPSSTTPRRDSNAHTTAVVTSTSAKEETVFQRPPEVSLDDITFTQQPSGNWEIEDIERYFTTSPSKENVCKSKSVWATLLVIQLLELKYADNNNEWILMAEKAMQWLKKQESNEEVVKTWKEQAIDFVKEYAK